MAIVSLEYALNYCRIDIDPDDEAYKIEIQLVKDCIAAAEEYLKMLPAKTTQMRQKKAQNIRRSVYFYVV